MTAPILYFVVGNVPTNEEFNSAFPLMGKGPIVQFISVANLDLNGPLLPASAVAGSVPAAYESIPRADARANFEEDKPETIRKEIEGE